MNRYSKGSHAIVRSLFTLPTSEAIAKYCTSDAGAALEEAGEMGPQWTQRAISRACVVAKCARTVRIRDVKITNTRVMRELRIQQESCSYELMTAVVGAANAWLTKPQPEAPNFSDTNRKTTSCLLELIDLRIQTALINKNNWPIRSFFHNVMLFLGVISVTLMFVGMAICAIILSTIVHNN